MRGVSSINKQTSSLLHLQQQVASGRRILSPSDDPVAAARALEVTQSQDVTAQFKLNHNNANSALGLEEAQLSSASDLLARIRELAVQGGNTALSHSDRLAITFELRARFDEMVGIANASDGSGQYLFSGFMGSTKPFGGTVDSIVSGNEIAYQGDDGQRRLQVSPTRFLEVSDSGNDVFKRVRNGNGYFTTNYAAGNAGTAIIDAGSVTDPAAWNSLPTKNFSVSFSVDNTVVPPVTYYDIVDTDPTSGTFGNSMLTGAAPVLPPTPGSGQRVYHSGQPIVLKSQGAESPFDLGASVLVTGDPASRRQLQPGAEFIAKHLRHHRQADRRPGVGEHRQQCIHGQALERHRLCADQSRPGHRQHPAGPGADRLAHGRDRFHLQRQ
jgi:flagellar hook-associated protein 3 FlgL